MTCRASRVASDAQTRFFVCALREVRDALRIGGRFLGMNEFYSIGIGVFNFILLIFFLYVFFRPQAKQFFFARRETIRKRVISSAWKLKKAQFHLKETRVLFDSLPDEIKTRAAAVESSSREECDAILDEANERCEHILGNAKKKAEFERADSEKLVRKRLLLDAFRRAELKLKRGMTEETLRATMDRGMAELVSADDIWQASLFP